MTTYERLQITTTLLAGLTVMTTSSSGLAAGKETKDTGKTPATFQVVPEMPIPQSNFVIPSQPTEGRNPFFPQSTARIVPVVKFTPANVIDPSLIVLNGITSPPRRTAMINGRTFEPGEEGEVRLASGNKTLIKCEEIRADSAIIVVGGQHRELRMRSGL
jgi:hypothetical protein